MNTFFKLFTGIIMVTTAIANETATVTFRSQEALENALEPLSIEKVQRSAATAGKHITFKIDENLPIEIKVPLRNRLITAQDLQQTTLYKTKHLTVYYPESPRVPHHLVIAFNRDIKGFDLKEEENTELFNTIKRIAEIYKTCSIDGYVISHTMRDGQYIVQIKPHLPGFNAVKNVVDKVSSSTEDFFPYANFTPIKYDIPEEEVEKQANFWVEALDEQKIYPALAERETTERRDAYYKEAMDIAFHNVLTWFEDKGATIESSGYTDFQAVVPTEVPNVEPINIRPCFFCNEEVIQNQLVYEDETVWVLYNLRKEITPGSSFLILPKEHTEDVYGIKEDVFNNMCVVRQALVDVLKEAHKGYEVAAYTQNGGSVGQTVFHTHEQVHAYDPHTIGYTWSAKALDPSEKVPPDEMQFVREKFGSKLNERLKGNPAEQEAA